MNWTSSKFKAIALKNIKKMKRQATEWGNYLQFMCLAKELYPEYVRRQIIKKSKRKRFRQTLPKKTDTWPASTRKGTRRS